MKRIHSGMTLVELLIVIVLVGIITSVAVPSYRGYVIRANRTDGKVALLATAGALERCYTRFNSYTHADCPVALPAPSPDGHYQIESLGIDENEFSIQAVPLNEQAEDSGCGKLRLDSRNAKTVSGSKPATECWDR